MLLLHKSVKAAQIKTIILFNIAGFNKRGATPERTPNCSNFRMLLSTCVCNDATHYVWIVPLADT